MKEMDRLDTKSEIAMLQEKANSNLKIARGMYVSKYGIGSIVRPKFWLMTIPNVTLSNPVPIIIAFIVGGIALMAVLYGVISAAYSLYFLKAMPCIIANVLLTIGNAIWFGFHGLSQLMLNGFTQVINSMFYWFVGPIINAVNVISSFLTGGNILDFADMAIGSTSIPLQPTHAFAYYVPGPVVWGDWASLATFTAVSPGADPYLTGEYISVVSQNGAELLYPQMNMDGISSGWWTELTSSSGTMYYSWNVGIWENKLWLGQAYHVGSIASWTTEIFSGFQDKLFGWIADPVGGSWFESFLWSILGVG